MKTTKIKGDCNVLKKWASHQYQGYETSEYQKKEFHKAGKKVLQWVLSQLGTKGEVRSCLGGPAVLGEVILHTDYVYVQLCQLRDKDIFTNKTETKFMFRGCNGRGDFVGQRNHWYSYDDLANNPEQFVELLHALALSSVTFKV